MAHFNEHTLEMAIMELFQNEGYICTNGEEIHKEISDVLLKDDLRMYLRSRYEQQGITALEIESSIAKLSANNDALLYDNNVSTFRLITEGFSLKREDASLPDLFIEAIDLILVLAEYGYPPVTNDEVFKEIFEQAENFKKYNDN